MRRQRFRTLHARIDVGCDSWQFSVLEPSEGNTHQTFGYDTAVPVTGRISSTGEVMITLEVFSDYI